MSSSAIVNDGQITNLGTTAEAEAKKNKKADSVDKEQFLNLLVTELKYQDPLQPMDNTEYVAQLATFSELEQMQNVAKTTEVSRATAMVGSLVTVESLNETTGAVTEITGKVDYVSVNGSKVKVSVNDTLYDLSDVKQVFDADYADAVALAQEFATAYGQLPGINNLTSTNASGFEARMRALYETFNGMSAYQKTFLSADIQAGMEAYVARFKEYGIDVTVKEAASAPAAEQNTDAKQNTDNTTDTKQNTDTSTETTESTVPTEEQIKDAAEKLTTDTSQNSNAPAADSGAEDETAKAEGTANT